MLPLGHTIHAVVAVGLYWPAAHAVHVVAPTPANVSVTDPGEHATHADVDALLYLPASHGVQLTAPDALNVFVTEPAAQSRHAPWPALPWYFPVTHAMHCPGDAA